MISSIILMRDEAILQELDLIARQKNCATEEIIQEALTEYVERHRAQESEDPLLGLIGLFASGYTDTSERDEELLAIGVRPA